MTTRNCSFRDQRSTLAGIVESLTELIETKPLAFGERGTLERAKRLLVCEISEVTDESSSKPRSR
jgi:RNA polymerase-interacting CarD/CdnL/TRCF family regulator